MYVRWYQIIPLLCYCLSNDEKLFYNAFNLISKYIYIKFDNFCQISIKFSIFMFTEHFSGSAFFVRFSIVRFPGSSTWNEGSCGLLRINEGNRRRKEAKMWSQRKSLLSPVPGSSGAWTARHRPEGWAVMPCNRRCLWTNLKGWKQNFPGISWWYPSSRAILRRMETDH